jgi:hypothetical protein
VTITAETQGAKVEFTLPTLHSGDYQAFAAFISELPESSILFSVANISHQRSAAPCLFLQGQNAGQKTELRFRLFDTWRYGRVTGWHRTGRVAGMRFSQIELDMASWAVYLMLSLSPSVSEKW